MSQEFIWIAYSISNLVALLLLWLSFKKPTVARFFLFLLFGWACWVNWTTAHQHPEVYLEYADFTFLPFYKTFILGYFRQHITIIISLIAIGQAFISLSMWMKGFIFQLGCFGAIVFLTAIAPLGVGSAFPFSVIVIIGLIRLVRKVSEKYIWEDVFWGQIKRV